MIGGPVIPFLKSLYLHREGGRISMDHDDINGFFVTRGERCIYTEAMKH